MSVDKTTHRDVQRETAAPNHAHIDSSHLQQGAAKPNHAEQSHANQKIEKMGFPKTEISHADHHDRNFSPSSKLNGKPEGGKPEAAKPEAKPEAAKRDASEGATRGVKVDQPAAAKGDQPAAKGDQPAAKGDQPAANGDQPAKLPPYAKVTDKPTTGSEKYPDGSSQSLVKDDLRQNYTGFSRDKDGHVNQISKIENGKPAETTTYSKDGKPMSESEKGNGSRTWDHNGKLTSDTRKDKSDQSRPDTLKTTKNADGSTTVRSGDGDGRHMDTTFGKDGNVTSQETNSGGGSKLRTEFNQDGTPSRQQYTSSDKKGKTLEQGTVDYGKDGVVKREEHTDYKGNRTLAENDENGKPVKRERDQPGEKFSNKESWDKTTGYKSVTQNGDNRTTATVNPNTLEVDFKHEKIPYGQ